MRTLFIKSTTDRIINMALMDLHLEEEVREIVIGVQVLMAKAKQKSSNLFMAFLVLKDPYNNVFHSAVMEAIGEIPMAKANTVKQFVMAGQEFRRPGRGIRESNESEMPQIVLALCMYPVMAAIDQSKGFPISPKMKVACKAFVEKMVLFATTEDDMKEHLNTVGVALKAIGLDEIDTEHCRYVAMTFNNGQMSVENDLDFTLNGRKIRGIQKNESWKFLGKEFEVK